MLCVPYVCAAVQDVDEWAAVAASEYFERANYKYAYYAIKKIRYDVHLTTNPARSYLENVLMVCQPLHLAERLLCVVT